jgi:hypothetical protein
MATYCYVTEAEVVSTDCDGQEVEFPSCELGYLSINVVEHVAGACGEIERLVFGQQERKELEKLCRV